MPNYSWILIPLALVFSPIGARILWHLKPSVWTCALFWLVLAPWLVAVTWNRSGWELIPSVLLFLGAFCNASVTLANKGRMPTGAKAAIWNIWVGIDKSTRLAWLGDRLFGHFSVGDVLLASGFTGLLLDKWLNLNIV